MSNQHRGWKAVAHHVLWHGLTLIGVVVLSHWMDQDQAFVLSRMITTAILDALPKVLHGLKAKWVQLQTAMRGSRPQRPRKR